MQWVYWYTMVYGPEYASFVPYIYVFPCIYILFPFIAVYSHYTEQASQQMIFVSVDHIKQNKYSIVMCLVQMGPRLLSQIQK